MPSIHQKMNERTRSLIRETFIELVAECGFDKVTIRQIVEKVGINRGRFYLHYSDKYDPVVPVPYGRPLSVIE
ncbi:TetR/AcrR family transcriptional regulator [Saccharibacillus sacchari]|uniref:TetR/AcrR family transcriptional regulator n=1 Tax=Saccharibacillus sacchari TaxID=456493 RepID=A0ACC6PEC0_9BACL